MNYALIKNNIVVSLIGIYPTNWNEFDKVLPVQSNIMVGDEYINDRFYRDGELVPTLEEILEAEMADMKTALEILGVNP